jgi:CheY-like chemotaxis protein
MLILNVDDDIDDREMFQAAVSEIDPEIHCLQFESGIKVLSYLAQAELTASYIFIDINMPKMNGYECVEHIRHIPGNEHMRIVMYSTAFNPKLRDDFNDPSIRYVSKTSRLSELVHSIKLILSETTESVEKSRK